MASHTRSLPGVPAVAGLRDSQRLPTTISASGRRSRLFGLGFQGLGLRVFSKIRGPFLDVFEIKDRDILGYRRGSESFISGTFRI